MGKAGSNGTAASLILFYASKILKSGPLQAETEILPANWNDSLTIQARKSAMDSLAICDVP
jgi:hypothetical protein